MPHTVDLELLDGLRFRVRTGSGHEIEIDSGDEAAGGGDGGARPMELVLASLAGCAAMDVMSILRKMRQNVASYRVSTSGERAQEHPKKYTTIEIVHRLAGTGIGEPNVRRAIFLSMSRYCPVFAMVAPSVPVRVRYEISDAAGTMRVTGEIRLDDPDLAEAPAVG